MRNPAGLAVDLSIMKLEGLAARTLVLVLCSTMAWAQGSRVLITENTSLRARPSMDSEILATLKKGQTCDAMPSRGSAASSVSADPVRWVELTAPSSARVWVSTGLVDPVTRKVRVERANLRAGPGTNFTEVGHLSRGADVEIATQLDGWTRIAAPKGAVRGFVDAGATTTAGAIPGEPGYARSSRRQSSTASPKPVATPQVPLPSPASRPPAGAGRAVPAAPFVSGRPLVAPTTAPAATSAAAPLRGAPVPVEAAPPLPTTSKAPVPVPVQEPSPAENLIPPPPVSGRQPEIVFSSDRPRQVVRQGVVVYAMSPQAPGRYQLESLRKDEGTLAFLVSEDPALDLQGCRSKQVVIRGEEYRDARWRTRSVIKVQSIEALP